MSDKYSYSATEDNYTGEFDSREEALEEAKAEYPDARFFWTGRNVPVDPLRYVHADWLIEHIINYEDFCIEQAEGWPDCTDEQKSELTAALKQVFSDWMDKHNLRPTFWLVEDVRIHEVEAAATTAAPAEGEE
jgi:hypothetical protein